MSVDRRINHYVQIVGSFGTGGNGRLATNLAMAIAERGIRSTCIAVRPGGAESVGGHGINCVDLGAGRDPASRLRAMSKLRRFVQIERPHLIHIHGPQSLQLVHLAIAGIRQRPQIWFTWHDSETVVGGGGIRRRMLCRAIRRCDMVFGSSRSVVQRLDDAVGVPGLASVFVNGVPCGEMTAGHRDPIPRILWMGRLVPPKDPGILLRAAARLHAEGCNFHLTIAGKAPDHLRWFEEQIRRDAKELGIDGVVSFPGWVSDVRDLLGASSIAVQTSHTEGLSVALLEQMMAGLAVIATNVGDTQTALAAPNVGILIDPGDEQAICDSLHELLASRERRIKMGSAARTRAIERYSTGAVADNVLALIAKSS